MPELPEVEALVHFLNSRTRGHRLRRLELASFGALKTVHPSIKDLVGRELLGWQRRGKYLCLELDGTFLVVHLARGGWVKWYDRLPGTLTRPGRSPVALRVGLDPSTAGSGAPGFDVTEGGTEKRLSLWVVDDPHRIDAVASLGIDPLDSAFSRAALAQLLAGTSGTIKSALTTQSLLAGVGNAYSDESLHAARLSPFKPARRLSETELAVLHGALLEVLGGAVDRAVGLEVGELKASKRAAMRVHGRTGLPCPTCGDTVSQVAFANKSLQYCPTCQTGGRQLADRRLSRLLK